MKCFADRDTGPAGVGSRVHFHRDSTRPCTCCCPDPPAPRCPPAPSRGDSDGGGFLAGIGAAVLTLATLGAARREQVAAADRGEDVYHEHAKVTRAGPLVERCEPEDDSR